MAESAHVDRLAVTLHVDGEELPVGTLAWSRARRAAAFEFDLGFVARRLPISPFRLAAGPDVRIAPTDPFAGLFGVFADSLPDGWGRLLLDRSLRQVGGDPGSLTPLDRLAIVGRRGMGALVYRPQRILGATGDGGFDIDALAASAAAIQAGAGRDAGLAEDVEVLLGANGGSAGARPKILVLRDPVTRAFRLDAGVEVGSGDAWLVKFRSKPDPPDAGRIEDAVARTARMAGIRFPDTMTILGGSGDAHYAVRRFDRIDGRRIHVHTLAGLLHADFRQPSVDYGTLLQTTRILTGRADEIEEGFRRAVFNVAIANRDDHAKNHAFAMGADGDWTLTPAYDVTPSDGPGGEHSLAIDGEGRSPGRADVMRLAQKASIKPATANAIVEQVRAAVADFATQAANAGLPEATMHDLVTRFAATDARMASSPQARRSGAQPPVAKPG